MPSSVPRPADDRSDGHSEGQPEDPATGRPAHDPAGPPLSGTRALDTVDPQPAPGRRVNQPPPPATEDVQEPAPTEAGGRRRGGLATILLLVLGLCLVATAAVLADMPRAYESEATVALEPRTDQQVPSAAMITLLAAPYVSYAAADSTLESVAEATDVPIDEVRNSVRVTMEPDSTNVEVRATSDEPTVATAVAAEVASRIENFASADNTLVADVVVPAGEAEPTTNDRMRPVLAPVLLVVGLVLVLAGAARAVLAVRRRRSATRGDTSGLSA